MSDSDSDVPQTLGARIRLKRREANLTAEELGKIAGKALSRKRPLSASAVRNQENGTNGVPWEVLHAYATAFGVSFQWLAFGHDEHSPLKSVPDEDTIKMDDVFIAKGLVASGDWILLTEMSDDVFKDTPMWFYLPGFENIELTYHTVIDDSMEPTYSRGTKLIACSYWEVALHEGDHVLVWYQPTDGSTEVHLSIREIRKVRGRFELHGIGDKVRPVVPLEKRTPSKLLEIESIILASVRIPVPSRRPPLQIPDEFIIETFDEYTNRQEEIARQRASTAEPGMTENLLPKATE